MKLEELKSFLDFKSEEFESPAFIEKDPIQIPHQFSKKEDIEIAGFLSATIAWGNRASIIKNAQNWVARFLDEKLEKIISLKVLDAYFKSTKQI